MFAKLNNAQEERMNWKYAGAILGCVIILGNLLLCLFGHPLWHLLEFLTQYPLTSALVTMIFLFSWGSGLLGILFSLSHLHHEPFKTVWSRLSTALSIGGTAAWICVAGVEPYWQPGMNSLVTLMFFLTWSFSSAICFIQEVLPMLRWPRRIALEFVN